MNECLLYGIVLSLSIILSLGLSTVPRRDAMNSNYQNMWAVMQVHVHKNLFKNGCLAFTSNTKGLY